MAIEDLQRTVDAINNDYVSPETEQAVRKLFGEFSTMVSGINRNITIFEVDKLIASFTKGQSLLRGAEINRYVPRVKDNTAQQYKDFEVTFQNVIVRLGRQNDEWVFYYTTTS